ncbi:MAG TPA: SGNH/GDSL hydrolase family protein [Gemmatimonadales bacterium]|nr:SGNH/GDSL hydrolase family protein [Gemmatimonadales bacterium]
MTPSGGDARLRFLALGDSYTIGEGVLPGERWPDHLVRLLGLHGIRVDPPEIIARTGWTTDELQAGVAAATLAPPYDLVSLLIGVNNQYRGRSIDEYREQFRTLLGQAVTFAGRASGRVLVLSIPDWGVTPFAEGRDRKRIGAEVESFNVVNRDEAGRVGARHVDILPASRLAAGSPQLSAADGLHPSGPMYSLWAELALPHALAALQPHAIFPST